MCSTGRIAFISALLVFTVLTASTSVAAPLISNVSATANTTGTPVTITGSGFGATQGTSTVKFFGVTAHINSWSDASIVAQLPTVSNGQATVVVTVGGVASNTAFFAVMNPLTYSLMPSSGVVGTSVTIWGSNFGSTQGASTVTFNGTSAQVSAWGNYSIVAAVPTGVPNGNISVKVTVSGIASNTQTFTVGTSPFISLVSMNFGSYSISANSAPINQDVTISGVNFGNSQGSSTITFNGIPAIANFWSNNTIVATVPTGATTGNVLVAVNSVSSNAVAFLIPPPAQIGGVGFVQGNYSANAMAEYSPSNIVAACYQDSSGMMTSTIQVPFPLEQNAGDLNVIIVSWRDTNADLQAVGDLANNQYTATGKFSQTGNGQQQIWVAPNIVGGTNIVNAVFESTKGNCVTTPEVRIAEYRGISTSSGLGAMDVSATQNSSSSATCNSGNKTTTNQNDLLVGANLAAQTTTGPGSSYANRVVSTPQGDILEDRIATATGSYSATATMAASGNCLMQMVAFKEATNQAPVVDPGPNQTITLPTNTVTLNGTVTDDGLPNNSLTIAWSKISGPGNVTFGNPSLATTQATFSSYGTYVLQLTGNDSQLQSSGNVTITVNPQPILVVLSPATAGPDVPGAAQVMTATVTTSNTPVSGGLVQFTVTGANPTTGSATTNTSGVATLSYTGTKQGTDTVQATYSGVNSNTASVTWVTPVKTVSTSTVYAQFFPATYNQTQFTAVPGQIPWFTEEFPTIDFNAPSNTIPGDTSGIGINTRPFYDITTDFNGNFTGVIPAQGNGIQAGGPASCASNSQSSPYCSFQIVFAGTFTVASAGNATITLFYDDGFILGIGGGATRVSGVMTNPPANGLTPFNNFTVVGADNRITWGGPNGNAVVVNFPGPGTYPYELDYFEDEGGQEEMTMAVGTVGAAPAGSLVITPNTPAGITVGQVETLTVTATDGSGAPIANLGIELNVEGANQKFLSGTTNSSGQAIFSYTGSNGGNDTVQAVANIAGMGSLSNVVTVPWSVPAGGGCSVFIFTPQGWIGSPAIGATVQGQVPITLASGITLTSGTLKMFPSSNPSQITVLNSNTTGTGPLTLGTIDGTLLANGEYTIQLEATQSTGACQLNEIVVSVIGQYKAGRKTVTITDFKVPVAGIPINITRTYDSLNRGTVGDFGNGWNLSTNVQLSVDQLMNVTFTWNGKTQTFYFTPQSAGQALFPWMVLPHYTPQPGLYGSLTSNGCSILIYVGGALVQDSLGVACFPAGTYQPTSYTYTDPSGRAYVIASTGQLQSIKDLNGNMLTFASNGITSSVSGVVIPFVRDSLGRITKITDLNGNSYQYTYDAGGSCPLTGPLCSVTFTGDGSNRGTYTYFPDNSLNTFTDPNGKASLATYYPDGRLETFTDANQNQWSYSYNVATRTTTTTNPDQGVVTRTDDSFGNPLSITEQVNSTTNRTTTYTYDANENLHSVTSPCGNAACSDTLGTNHTTTYGYDANGFKTSVQDPLGHTSTKTYNQFGGVKTSTDAANSNTETTTYYANFNPQQVTDLLNGPGTQVSSFTYDTMGNVLTYTDANGKTTTYTYYPNGTVFQIFDPLNEVTTFTYDSMNRPLTKTDPLGHKTTYTYDTLGNLHTVTDPMMHVTTYTYDNNGNKQTEKDADGNTTTYGYDNMNHVNLITYPDHTTKSYTYDFRENKLTETDQAGHTTKYAYDLAGQLTSVTSAYGTVDAGPVTYTYDLDGRRATVQDEVGNVTNNTYDAAGRLITVTDMLSHATNYGYDADNRQSSVQDANLNTTTYGYDVRGRMTTITYPIVPPATQPTTKLYSYDGVGHILTTTDQAGKVTTNTYDDVGRLSTVTDAILPNPNVTKYFYDFSGNLRFQQDAAGRVTTYQYYPDNRKLSRMLPLNQLETYIYDPAGNLATKTDFNGRVTTYTYDTLNRLSSRVPDASLNQPTVSFTYTPTGQRLSMTDASGTTNYTVYDNRDRLKTKVTPEGTLNYTYDAHSNLKSIVSSNTNGASLAYSYDALNRLSQVCDNRIAPNCGAAGVTTYTYDAVSNLASYLYPNTVRIGNAFDTQNRLTQTCAATTSPACSASQKLASFAYTLGNAGNRTNVAELNGRSLVYGYDNDYRLLSEAISGDPAGNNGSETYTYDAVGNRLTLASTIPSLSGSLQYSYDDNDRLATDGYDANGNTITSGGISNTYDFENRMLTHGGATLVYDGDGNLVSETIGSTTTKYLVNDKNPTSYSQVMDEIVNGAVTRTYSYGRQLISEDQLINGTWTPSFYGYDGHGNVRFLANAAGTITDTYTFDGFGAPIANSGTTSNSYLYDGERFDSNLNLYYLRARYYDMLTGRFWTRDPVKRRSCCGSGSCSSQQSNPYIYADDDPVDRLDPTGKAAIAEYAIDLRPLIIATPVVIYFSINVECNAELTRCLLTSLNDLPGSVYGSTRCLWCHEACIRNGYWPSSAPGINGTVRCDYWNFPSTE